MLVSVVLYKSWKPYEEVDVEVTRVFVENPGGAEAFVAGQAVFGFKVAEDSLSATKYAGYTGVYNEKFVIQTMESE